MSAPLQLSLDASPYLAAVSEIGALFPALAEQAPDVAAHAFDALFGAFDRCDGLARIELDLSATARAGEVAYRLVPTQALLGALAALRAGDFDLGVLEQAMGHRVSPFAVTNSAGEAGQGLPGSPSKSDSPDFDKGGAS